MSYTTPNWLNIYRNMLDIRSQERYLNKKLLKENDLKENIIKTSDLDGSTVSFTERQPAIGLFDEQRLKQIQDAWKNKGK